MSFLYPRTITIQRDRAKGGEGRVGYGGRTPADLELVRDAVPASVQSRNGGNRNPVALPTDGKMAQWYIHVPRGALDDGEVRDGDLITDDLGRRFAVTSDYCHPLGARFTCERLEA